MNRIEKLYLEKYAKILLLATLPILVLSALGLVFFIIYADIHTLMVKTDAIYLFVGAIVRGIVCLTAGCIALDIMEKKKVSKK